MLGVSLIVGGQRPVRLVAVVEYGKGVLSMESQRLTGMDLSVHSTYCEVAPLAGERKKLLCIVNITKDERRTNMNEDIRVVLYARVSTKDKQEVENQLLQLHQYCQKNAYTIVREYIDRDSGSNPDRKEFKQLFKDAYQKKFDIVLFWALDRFSREGARETINYLSQLESYQVNFISYSEPYLNSLGVFKEAIISILATLAKQEKIRIQERVRAGMAIARLKGIHLGRKPTPPAYLAKIIDVFEKKNLSSRQASKLLNIPRSTCQRTIKQYQQGLLSRDGLSVVVKKVS